MFDTLTLINCFYQTLGSRILTIVGLIPLNFLAPFTEVILQANDVNIKSILLRE